MKRFSLGSLVLWLATTTYLLVFLVYPILYVFVRAFIVEGRFSLAYFYIMTGDPVLRESIFNSFLISTLSTILTVLAGYAIAYVMVRFDFKLKHVFEVLLLLPFVVPPFVGAIGMIQLFARFGAVNAFLMQLGVISRPIDWFGNRILGIVLLEVLHLYPIAYLNIAAALSNIDPTLEESAETLGVKGLRKFATVTFPLSLPGVAAATAIVFIWSFTDLGTPLMFNFYKVVPVQIFHMAREIYANPMGYALTVLVLLLISIIFLGIKRYTTARSYEMLGRGHVSVRLGRMSKTAEVLVSVLLGLWVFAAALPHISVILLSFSERWFLTVIPSRFTIEHYISIFTNDLTSISIRNSLFYSFLATLLSLGVGLLTAYVANRGKLPQTLRDILDMLAMWPLAVPGIALAFGYLSAFSDVPLLSAYGNPTLIIIIAYATRRLPYMVRTIYAGLQQVHRSLEEAAVSLGSRPFKVVMQITIPLILANIFAGSILVFSECMIEVSTSLMLALREEYFPMTKAIYEVSTNLAVGPELASALGVILMIIVSLSMIITSKLMGAKMGELFRA